MLTLPYQSIHNRLWDEDTAVSSEAQERDDVTMLSVAALANAANASPMARSLVSNVPIHKMITNEVFDLFPDATEAAPSLPAPNALVPMTKYASMDPPAQPRTLFQTARSSWSSMGMQCVDSDLPLRSAAPANSLCDIALMPDSPAARDSMTAASDRPFGGLSATSDSALQASPSARSVQQHALATSSLSDTASAAKRLPVAPTKTSVSQGQRPKTPCAHPKRSVQTSSTSKPSTMVRDNDLLL